MADIAKEIINNSIVLIILDKESYPSQIFEISRMLASSSKKLCYISFNQPFSSLSNNLKKKGINNSFIIDSVTKSVQNAESNSTCLYISSPAALTEAGIAFSKALTEYKCDSAIFDSLSTLLAYENSHAIIQFSHNIITKVRINNGKAVLITLKEDTGSELIKDLYMFVDKVVDSTK